MVKKYEAYNFFKKNDFKPGERVIVKFKDSKYFMQTGTILYIITKGVDEGDIEVKLDDGEHVKFFYTNLDKIVEIIEFPSGEVFKVLLEDAVELASTGLIKFNVKYEYYYFEDHDRWQIDVYML